VTYRIEFTAAEHDDLVNIGNYIRAHADDVTADRFVERLVAKAESLRSMPLRYRVRDELRPALRATSMEKYLIFYRVLDTTVRIYRVLHGARNITAEFFAK
jgi:toxin ParE1/3/4